MSLPKSYLSSPPPPPGAQDSSSIYVTVFVRDSFNILTYRTPDVQFNMLWAIYHTNVFNNDALDNDVSFLFNISK